MKKLRTLEEILDDREFFTEEQANKIRADVDKKVAKIKAKMKICKKSVKI
jgi:ElaB/YqjD/DUF883 family membrane-anchored ribosome-binding protein